MSISTKVLPLKITSENLKIELKTGTPQIVYRYLTEDAALSFVEKGNIWIASAT